MSKAGRRFLLALLPPASGLATALAILATAANGAHWPVLALFLAGASLLAASIAVVGLYLFIQPMVGQYWRKPKSAAHGGRRLIPHSVLRATPSRRGYWVLLTLLENGTVPAAELWKGSNAEFGRISRGGFDLVMSNLIAQDYVYPRQDEDLASRLATRKPRRYSPKCLYGLTPAGKAYILSGCPQARESGQPVLGRANLPATERVE